MIKTVILVILLNVIPAGFLEAAPPSSTTVGERTGLVLLAKFPDRHDFTWYEVIELFQQQPELALINEMIKAKQTQEVDDKKR